MEVRWTDKAIDDLGGLLDFLASVNRPAAARTVKAVVATPQRLLEHPRLGEQLDEFTPNEVRRLLISRYEMRYELRVSTIFVLGFWHTREDR